VTGSKPHVVVLDYGSGNLRSAQRALQRIGADVAVTADPQAALNAAGLVVPGVGAFAACMAGLRAARGDELIAKRLAGSRPVLGICVGMQVLFVHGAEGEQETGRRTEGCAVWPGLVERLAAPVLPHMGWNTLRPPLGSRLFAGIGADERFYFLHSYAVMTWATPTPVPLLAWATHGQPFVAAAEDGALCATQFHPEKSGDAGAALLANWLELIR
jgi:glutamine amidotransferase